MSWYFTLLWLVLVLGFIPGVFFIATFRPRRSRRRDALDVVGLPAIVILLYVLTGVGLVVGQDSPPSTVQAIFGLGLGACIDAALWLRAIRWRRVRRDVRRSLADEA